MLVKVTSSPLICEVAGRDVHIPGDRPRVTLRGHTERATIEIDHIADGLARACAPVDVEHTVVNGDDIGRGVVAARVEVSVVDIDRDAGLNGERRAVAGHLKVRACTDGAGCVENDQPRVVDRAGRRGERRGKAERIDRIEIDRATRKRERRARDRRRRSHAAGDDAAGVHIDDRRIRLPRLLHVEHRAFAEIQRAAVRISGLMRDAVDHERVVAADADDRGNVIKVDARIHIRDVDGQRRRRRAEEVARRIRRRHERAAAQRHQHRARRRGVIQINRAVPRQRAVGIHRQNSRIRLLDDRQRAAREPHRAARVDRHAICRQHRSAAADDQHRARVNELHESIHGEVIAIGIQVDAVGKRQRHDRVRRIRQVDRVRRIENRLVIGIRLVGGIPFPGRDGVPVGVPADPDNRRRVGGS